MKRHHLWIAAALVLLGLAAFVMSRGDEDEPKPAQATAVNLPRRMREADRERAEARRTFFAPPPNAAAAPKAVGDAGTSEEVVRSSPPPRPKDPVLAAIPASAKFGVVVEANAVRNSPVGELAVKCLLAGDGKERLDDLKEKSGIDVLQQVDRLVVSDGGLMVSGHFKDAKWEDMGLTPGDRIGDHGRRYTTTNGRGETEQLAVWNDEMLIVGDNAEALQRSIDRIEGRGPEEKPLIGDDRTYGELYGVVSAEALAQMLPPDQQALAERLKEVAKNVELHVDASNDVGVVAKVDGAGGQGAEDLAKSVGTAMALARVKAQADGREQMARMLDFARVKPGEAGFDVEMALPLSFFEDSLKKCVERKEARRQARLEAEKDGTIEAVPPEGDEQDEAR